MEYKDLDERTLTFMAQEVESDLAAGKLYLNPRLNEAGRQGYPALLLEAVKSHDDEWLADELDAWSYLKESETRQTESGETISARVPVTAAEQLAEGDFNRYYMRGLCLRALDEGIPEVVVYRGRQASEPRPESEALIGESLPAKDLLEALRNARGDEPALGLAKPNSGLTVRLP